MSEPGKANMKVLAKLLASTHVCSLIRSKGSKKCKIFTLSPNDTIRTALNIFIDQEISAIPIQKTPWESKEFVGILNVSDVLKYILKGAPESFYTQDVETLLDRPIQVVIEECGIRNVLLIQEQLSLMKLLLNHWSFERMAIADKDGVDNKHLLVQCGNGKFNVVTPSDLLRYILLLSNEGGYLRKTNANAITSTFTMDDGKIAHGDEDAWKTFSRLLDTEPFYLMALLDPETGHFESNVSAIDFISSKKTVPLELNISMLRRPGISIYSYICATRPVFNSTDLEPIVVKDHYTLADLIEKMAKLKVHQLWRVTTDRSRKPIGIVAICDVIQFLCTTFEKYRDIS
jgi:CBS domain-containing protein